MLIFPGAHKCCIEAGHARYAVFDGKPTSKAMQDQQDGCVRSQIAGVAALEPVQGNAATVRTCEQLSVVVGVAGQATKSCRAKRTAGPQSEQQGEETHKQVGGSSVTSPKRT